MRLRLFLLGLLVEACGPRPPGTPPGKDPPQVFLLAPDANRVGTGLKLVANVNGCQQVSELAILDHDQLVKNVTFSQNPTEFELPGSDLGHLYPTLGIAADLVLTAKATCDDGRANTSLPAAVKFFPVEQVVSKAGAQMAPDSFVAEGGQGTPSTFIGCIGTAGGNVLARTDTAGAVVKANGALPFNCTISLVLTERHPTTRKRWMWEPGVGAAVFDTNLNITSFYLGDVRALGVGPDGDAIVWDDKRSDSLLRVAHNVAPPNNLRWGFQPAGIPMGSPVVQTNLNTAVVPVFSSQAGSFQGTVAVERIDYANGARVALNDLALVSYAFLDAPVIPPAAVSPDGSVLYFAYQLANSANTPSSSVMACSTTAAGGCGGAGLKWRSGVLAGLVLAVAPFANGAQVAAIGGQHTSFLNAQTGQLSSFAGKPLLATGSLEALGYQSGLGTDFFVLFGPRGGYPTEIVAVDSPMAGELYRYEMLGGTSAGNALTVAVDDAGRAWLRVGPDLVKPLAMSQYRQAKGPNRP